MFQKVILNIIFKIVQIIKDVITSYLFIRIGTLLGLITVILVIGALFVDEDRMEIDIRSPLILLLWLLLLGFLITILFFLILGAVFVGDYIQSLKIKTLFIHLLNKMVNIMTSHSFITIGSLLGFITVPLVIGTILVGEYRGSNGLTIIDLLLSLLFWLLFGFLIFIRMTILLLVSPIAVFVGESLRSFFLKILEQILNSVIGAGLFCGFMTVPTIGYFCYLVVAPRFILEDSRLVVAPRFIFEDSRARVAAMTGFVTGQFVIFTSVYNRPLFQVLVQRNVIIMLFLGFFLVQLLWTSLTTLRNWRFLYPNDKRKRVLRRLVLLQLEFGLSFLLQFHCLFIFNEPDSMISMIRRVVDSYLKDKAKNVLFVRTSFVGWFIGHIFFMILYVKLFEFIFAWGRYYISYYKSNNNKNDYDY